MASPPSAGHRTRALSFPRFTLRLHRRLVLAGSLAVAAAAVVVGVLGWNAPAGSPLYGIRAAKQGVQLAMPGADFAALHLSFAEQSLADARGGINPAASLANAGAELQQAHAALPPDHSSPLWSRYGDDQATFNQESADFENGEGGAGGGAPGVAPPSSESPEGTPRPSAESTSEPSERPTAEPSERPETSPTAASGGERASAPPSGAPTDR